MDTQAVLETAKKELRNWRKWARTVHDAEDLIQDTIVRLYSRSSVENDILNTSAFFRRTLRNLAIDNARQRQKNNSFFEDEELEAVPDDRPTPEQEAIVRRAIDVVSEELRAWPPAIQEAFLAHVFDRRPVRALAVELAMPRSTLHDSLAAVKQSLTERLRILD